MITFHQGQTAARQCSYLQWFNVSVAGDPGVGRRQVPVLVASSFKGTKLASHEQS